MLEPAGDLGLQQEPRAAVGVVGALGLDLLQRHLALELGVERDRDLADAPLGMRPEDAEPHALGRGHAQRPGDMARFERPLLVVRQVDHAGQERVVVILLRRRPPHRAPRP